MTNKTKLPEVGKVYKSRNCLGNKIEIITLNERFQDVEYRYNDNSRGRTDFSQFWNEFEELPDQELVFKGICDQCNKQVKEEDGYAEYVNSNNITCISCKEPTTEKSSAVEDDCPNEQAALDWNTEDSDQNTPVQLSKEVQEALNKAKIVLEDKESPSDDEECWEMVLWRSLKDLVNALEENQSNSTPLTALEDYIDDSTPNIEMETRNHMIELISDYLESYLPDFSDFQNLEARIERLEQLNKESDE